MDRAAQLAREIDRRLRRAKFQPSRVLFPAQQRAHADTSRWKALICSRQAGKSTFDAFELLKNAVVDCPGTDAVFVAPTFGQARNIIWRDLLALNEAYDLGGKSNETSCTITWPNGSTIQLRGVSDRADIEWFRGRRFSLAIIDEAQSIGAHLRELIWDVLRPTLMRYHGRVVLSGTVGLVAAGFWHDVVTGKIPGWSVHTWYLTDNPHIPDAAAEMADFAAQLGGVDNPKYVREILCRWVRDDSTLVYRIDPPKNTWLQLPPGKASGCVVAGDLGTRDFSAVVSLKWWDDDPAFYVTREKVRTGCDLEDVRQELETAIAEDDPDRIVLDEGGIGLMVAETLRRRYSMPVEPAQKMAAGGVTGQMDLLNTDIVRGRVKCQVPSRFLDSAAALQWDQDAAAKGLRKLDGHEPDVCAALRYGWYIAQQIHLWAPPVPKTEKQSRYEQIARELEERAASGVDEGDYDSAMAGDLAALGYG